GFLPDLGTIPADVARKAKILFLNYPNNPTGATATPEFFQEAVQFARTYNLILAHDNPYSEIAYDGYRAPSVLEIPGAKEVAIEFHSLSKTYCMTGWRVGFVVGNAAAVSALAKMKTNVDSGVFRAVQKAGIAALDGPQQFLPERLRPARHGGGITIGGPRAIGQGSDSGHPRGAPDRMTGPERAILVGLLRPPSSGAGRPPRDGREPNLDELSRLAESAGAVVAAKVLQKRRGPDPTTFVGDGKVEDLKRDIYEHSADLVILDGELTPAQQRNLERRLEVKVIDRTALVLDIFARRAHTKEGRLQ